MNTGPLRGLSEWSIAPMFPDTDLPLALIMKKFLDGKRKKIATRKKKILQVSNIFLQEIRSRQEIVTSSTDF